MDRKHKIQLGVATGGFVLLVLFLMHKRDKEAAPTVDTPKDEQVLATGASGFNSTINVGVNANSFNSLARQYMPTFGMVGVGVVNTGPTSLKVEYNTTTLQAPPMPQYMVPGLAPEQAMRMSVASRYVQ